MNWLYCPQFEIGPYGRTWFGKEVVSYGEKECALIPLPQMGRQLGTPTWGGSGYLTTFWRGERRTSAAVTKDRVPRGPNLVKQFCTPWTPPVNLSLQSSGPSDFRFLPNHGDQPRSYRSGLAPRRFGKQMRLSTKVQSLSHSLESAKWPLFRKWFGAKGDRSGKIKLVFVDNKKMPFLSTFKHLGAKYTPLVFAYSLSNNRDEVTEN